MAIHAIADLSILRTTDRPPRFDNEANFHHAFEAQKRVAEVLAAAGLHHDALVNLYISIECFLKHLYCLVRELEVSTDHDATPMGSLLRRSLGAKDRFRDHRLTDITKVLNAHTDLSNFVEYRNFERSLPPSGSWVEARYALRNHPAKRTEYATVLGVFNDFLNGCVKDLV